MLSHPLDDNAVVPALPPLDVHLEVKLPLPVDRETLGGRLDRFGEQQGAVGDDEAAVVAKVSVDRRAALAALIGLTVADGRHIVAVGGAGNVAGVVADDEVIPLVGEALLLVGIVDGHRIAAEVLPQETVGDPLETFAAVGDRDIVGVRLQPHRLRERADAHTAPPRRENPVVPLADGGFVLLEEWVVLCKRLYFPVFVFQ